MFSEVARLVLVVIEPLTPVGKKPPLLASALLPKARYRTCPGVRTAGNPLDMLTDRTWSLVPLGGGIISAPSSCFVVILRYAICVRTEETCSASAPRMRAAVVMMLGVLSKPAAPA